MKISLRWIFFWFSAILSCFLVLFFRGTKSVSLPMTSQLRIVSLTPNITELLFALGADESLVGVSDFCDLPPSKSSLPRCGGLLNPNFERILALRPSMLFLLGKMDRVAQFSKEQGIEAISVNIDSFADLLYETKRIGTMIGKSSEVLQLTDQLKVDLSSIEKAAFNVSHQRCLILLGRERGSFRKMMAIGQPSFLSEMLNLAGGINVFSSQKQGYFYTSREAVLALQPEIIFEIHSEKSLTASEKQEIADEWLVEKDLPAVQNRHIVILEGSLYGTPGPRMLLIAKSFQEYLKQFTIEKETPSKS
jgi:iron complex transport system substrate-binding protein